MSITFGKHYDVIYFLFYIWYICTVFEIKVLHCAHSGCMGSQNCAPGNLLMCSSLYKGINILEKACTHRVHRWKFCAPGTQGAGCTLNFEHWCMVDSAKSGHFPRYVHARIKSSRKYWSLFREGIYSTVKTLILHCTFVSTCSYQLRVFSTQSNACPYLGSK